MLTMEEIGYYMYMQEKEKKDKEQKENNKEENKEATTK